MADAPIPVGIDLGTTNSLVAAFREGRPEILPVDGRPLLPSVVSFTEEEILVGYPAKNRYVLDPDRTIRSVKRRMGDASWQFAYGDRAYGPPDISALILGKLKASAEEALGAPVRRAVITVPAYFGELARRDTMRAAELAGLEVARLLNEPTAAALAYGVRRDRAEKVLVYDLGGGTLDVSLVQVESGVIEVKASHGNRHLGGDDFDQRLVNLLAQRFLDKYGIDLRHDRQALARLVEAAEQAKIELSDHVYTRVKLEFIAQQGSRALHLDEEVSRQAFEAAIRDLVEGTLEPVRQVLKDTGLEAGDLDQVLLVGGSSRIPLVVELLAEELGTAPRTDLNPEQAIALGAAIEAAALEGVEVGAALVDVSAHSLGIRSARLDPRRGLVFDHYAPIIARNTPIPCSRSERFFTLTPEQDTVEIEVYQGESEVASANTFLGSFLFQGLSPDPYGDVREVVVRFDYDLNGMLRVTAIDRRAQRERSIVIDTARDVVVPMGEEAAASASAAAAVPEKIRPVYERLRALQEGALSDAVKEQLDHLLEQAAGFSADAPDEELEAWLDRATDFLFEHEPY